MNELVRDFKQFRLEGDQATKMHAEYELVRRDIDLTKCPRVPDGSGIYFWLMTLDSVEYKVYIGRTKSLSRRVKEYANEFQPHSPNDYKLRFFQEFMKDAAPGATLDLYSSKEMPKGLDNEETVAVNEYDPLINVLPKPTSQAKNALMHAYSIYYRSLFEQSLRS